MPDSIAVFESDLFPPFTEILLKDVDRTLSFRLVATVGVLTVAEYVTYDFQILTQMLTLHQAVPVDYRALRPRLLTPATWAQKGTILGPIALLMAFLACDAVAMVEANRHMSVLGIVQQRLVPSKANDGRGFELLQSVLLHIPLCVSFSDGGAGLHCNHISARSS